MFCVLGKELSTAKVCRSLMFNLLTDENKHDALIVSERMLSRTKDMRKFILPKMK